ncbi:MAG: DUF262 domain-containing protein [Hydrogenimonas sp.]|nr:MAG: DUF262 domain-containing protein [Hydrogenimonas sp.]
MANLNFNTSNDTFRKLLGNGLRYKIPPFQRDYSWGIDEWDDLWQDIMGLFEEDGEEAHYMGYLVLQSNNSKTFDIIDGQQRITTISILILASLAVLNDIADEGVDSENNRKRVENLRNSYIGYVDPVTLVPQPKLELNRHNNSFYQNYLVSLETPPQRGLNSSERLLRKAFFWFKDRIASYGNRDGIQIARLIDSIVDKLFFTVITVTDELNAFKVFETLNARGVRLSATDLLKNYLFAIISSGTPHDTQLKVFEDRWERIVGELGSESFPEFLRIYWNSKNRLVRKSDLFKTIRKKITTKEDAFSLIRSLDSSSSIYAALRNPNDSLWNQDERSYLKQLQMFNVRQPLAMLMSCYEKFGEEDRETFTQILRSIVTISFRYNVICNLQTNEQERVYNEIAYKLSHNEISTKEEIYEILKRVYPDDARFKASFSDKEFRTTNNRNKKVVRFILLAIEKQQSGQDFDFESDTYSLEHILPENPSDEWDEIDDQTHERFVYRLGNMTLLETSFNRELGNSGYREKREVYKRSQFRMTQKVAEHYNIWNEDKIVSRQKHMAGIANGIWRVEL